MDFAWLEDCIALADTLNFSRAADRRHVTQPAFSRRIRALEEWLGTPLFVRTTHGVGLTEAGEYFQRQARTHIRELVQSRRRALEIAVSKNGALTLTATHVLSFTFFPRWIRSNDHLLSLGNINLISDTMLACENAMLRGDTQFLLCHFHDDMGIRLGPAEFTSVVVGHDVLVPVCTPSPSGGAQWPLLDRPLRLLSYTEQSGLGRIVSGVWRDGRASTPVFKSHLAATLLSMTRAGEGTAWLPRTLVEEDLATGRLVPAAPAEYAIPVQIRLFRPIALQSSRDEEHWQMLSRTRL